MLAGVLLPGFVFDFCFVFCSSIFERMGCKTRMLPLSSGGSNNEVAVVDDCLPDRCDHKLPVNVALLQPHAACICSRECSVVQTPPGVADHVQLARLVNTAVSSQLAAVMSPERVSRRRSKEAHRTRCDTRCKQIIRSLCSFGSNVRYMFASTCPCHFLERCAPHRRAMR